ncbi:histidine kinase [Chitinispirillum alkaliphilum]|nr:histidine kinase [Chitinispirillum alkaliphilum]
MKQVSNISTEKQITELSGEKSQRGQIINEKKVSGIFDFNPIHSAQKSLLFIEQLINSLSAPSVVVNNRNKIIYSNHEFRNICLFDESELRCMYLSDIFTPRDTDQPLSPLHPGKTCYWEGIHNLAVKNRNQIKVKCVVNSIHKSDHYRIITIEKVCSTQAYSDAMQAGYYTDEHTVPSLSVQKQLRSEKLLQSLLTATETQCTSGETQCSLFSKCIAELVECEFVSVALIKDKRIFHISTSCKEGYLRRTELASKFCRIVIKKGHACRVSGDLKLMFSDDLKYLNNHFKSFLGVPVISSTGKLCGVICIADKNPLFVDDQILQFLKVSARIFSLKNDLNARNEQLTTINDDPTLAQITSGLAHEVRNPLNGIASLSDALQKDLGKKNKYKDYFYHIKSQTERLSHLTKQLLTLGLSIDSEKMTPNSLAKICNETIQLWKISSTHENRTVRLNAPIDEHNAIIAAQKEKLIEAFLHLLENAAQHSPGNSEIIIDIAEPGESHIIVRIVDNGSGLPLAGADRIFEPFFTTEKGRYGLGLSIVRRIIEGHKGSVAIRNHTSPRGCIVIVKLPLYN